MKEFKIESQSSLILDIIKALKHNCSGIGLRVIYDIKIERPSYNNSRIIFTAKDGKEINPRDFFYLGLDISR